MATASQSLFNMTVASDNGPGNQGLLMPKLQFRFRVNFINFGVDTSNGLELTKQVMNVSRPQVQFPEITIPIYNSTLYLAGRYAWQPMTITLRDDASGGVSKAVGQQLQRQLDFVEMSSAATGQDYKFQTNIQVLDGGNGANAPNVLETWEIYGCFIQTANYNNLDYNTNEPAQVALTLRYDNAIQSKGDSLGTAGVGQKIGRSLAGASVTGIGPASG